MTAAARSFDIICFDCDSTLSRIEGIDELARRAGVEAEVAPLSDEAMAGTLPIDVVYERRLSMVRPDRTAIVWLGERYIEEIVPGAHETVTALTRAGKSVHIVSGGLLPAVVPVAQALGIPESQVHAVDIEFAPDGAYRDFDRQSPLTRSDGKAVLCRQLAPSGRSIALVGDGATDLVAREAGAFFVGFGGVRHREVIEKGADAFTASPDLTAVLDVLL